MPEWRQNIHHAWVLVCVYGVPWQHVNRLYRDRHRSTRIAVLPRAGASAEQISCRYHDIRSHLARATLGATLRATLRRGREGKADGQVRARAQKLTKIRDQ